MGGQQLGGNGAIGGGEETQGRPGRVLLVQAAATYVAVCGDRIVTLDGVGLTAGQDDRPGHLRLGAVGDRGALGRGLRTKQTVKGKAPVPRHVSGPNWTYLKHHHANVVNALGDGVARAGDGDGALRRVGQHVRGHLDGRARHLADLLDLGAALADERAALRGRHDEAQRDGGAGRGGGAPVAVGALHLVELEQRDGRERQEHCVKGTDNLLQNLPNCVYRVPKLPGQMVNMQPCTSKKSPWPTQD